LNTSGGLEEAGRRRNQRFFRRGRRRTWGRWRRFRAPLDLFFGSRDSARRGGPRGGHSVAWGGRRWWGGCEVSGGFSDVFSVAWREDGERKRGGGTRLERG
jgi:hypothetical protein